MSVKKVKNLIFDLGGVILDLAVDDTLEAFSKLSGIGLKEIRNNFVSTPEFEMYEKGILSDAQFRSFIKENYNLDASDQAIDGCWNAMLKGLPIQKLHLLQRLKAEYQTLLLSNTNGIHLDHINNRILKNITGESSIDVYFHKAYYSHRMMKRKPEHEIFNQVLEENNLKPNETLFLDDNKLNIQGAAELGIQTVYITTPNMILEIFNESGN